MTNTIQTTIWSNDQHHAELSSTEYMDIDIKVPSSWKSSGQVSLARLTVRWTDELETYGVEVAGPGVILTDEFDNVVSYIEKCNLVK